MTYEEVSDLADKYYENWQQEKQQLISFLEDKIKEYSKFSGEDEEILTVLQEVLDFVNGDDKE